jgi:glycosyl transferase, family 25
MDQILSYVINLTDRTDRRIAMEKQLRLSGLKAHFFPAVRPDNAGAFPSIGARGCFLSHLAVLTEGERQNCHIMIMEDDLDFTDNFRTQWAAIVPELNTRPWSVFYPAHFLEELPRGLSELAPSTGVLCTHLVLFHRNAVPEIVAGLQRILERPAGHPDGGPMHVDGAYSTLRNQHPSLRTLAYSPALGSQRPSRSDIADLAFYDRVAVFRRGAEMVRGLKRSLGF